MILRLLLLTVMPFTAMHSQTVVPPALKERFPQLRVTPKVPTKRDEDKSISYKESMTISPQVVVESSPTAKMSEAKATMVIITMDTRAKYTERREVYKVWATETIPIPGVDRGGRREFAFKPSKVSYDAYRDTSNVGGNVYKWFIFGLRDETTKQLLHFETNNAKLTKHLAAHPDQREKYLGLAVGGAFTEEFK
jgi:hypothetical protein